MPAAPPAPWRLLFIEDSEEDCVLLVETLRRQGFACLAERVDRPAAVEAALDGEPWDAIIADYSLPAFSALDALDLVRARGLDLPFIVVSGTIGEERAVDVMRAGAHDYLPKDQLARLGVSLAREIREAQVRAEQRRLTASLDRALAETYGTQGEADRQGGELHARLRYCRTEHIFEIGLRPFLEDLGRRLAGLSDEIGRQFLFE